MKTSRDQRQIRISNFNFRNETRYYNKISLTKCENRDNSLYFRDKKYVFNLNRFRCRIIQFAHDSIVDKHFKKVKLLRFN